MPHPQPEAAPPVAAPEKPATLLVVDDEEGPRESLRLVFERDYRVLLASNGLEALEQARRERVDAAILDIRMSGMSGIVLLERLKHLDPDIQVTLLTAHAGLETAREAVRLGAAEYLMKPFEVRTIRDAARRMMERRRLTDWTKVNLARLTQLERELEEVREHEELLKDRAQVYGSVLHDINRPLTAIVGILHSLNQRLSSLHKLEGEELAAIRERIASANLQTDSIVTIVRRYLGFLRQDLEGGRAMGVNQVLADLEQLLSVYPASRERTVKFHPLQQDAQIDVNATDLLQLLLNLVMNALQTAPPARQVEVAARVSDTAPNVDYWRDADNRRFRASKHFNAQGPFVVFSVRDDGPGIPPEIVAQAFDAPIANRSSGHGTGLGLTIVKRLVVNSDGAIGLQTEPQRGTTITVFMPLTRRRRGQTEPPAGPNPENAPAPAGA